MQIKKEAAIEAEATKKYFFLRFIASFRIFR